MRETSANVPPPLRVEPGDCLLYRPSNLFGLIVALKTWTWLSHVEVYAGMGECFGSRAKGVRYYRLDLGRHLAYVLRPHQPFDVDAARRWFASARGQRYDYLGLLCFYMAARHGAKDRMFCSELATRLYRSVGLHPVSPWTDADHVAPAQFLQSPEFDIYWARHWPTHSMVYG